MTRVKDFFKNHKTILLFLTCLFILVLFIVPGSTTPGKYDRRVWITWSNFMLTNDLANIYKLGVDYLPLIQYILYFYALIQGTTENIVLNINQLKFFNFFIELVGVFYAYLLIKNKVKDPKKIFFGAVIIVLNPAYLYNSLLYGQWDGLYTTLALMSFYYAIKNNLSLCVLFFLMALNTKIQAIIFFPIIFVPVLENILDKFDIKAILKAITVGVVFQILILLPFYLVGDLQKVFDVAFNMVDRYPFVSMGANNFWNFFFDNPKHVLDSGGFWGYSYNSYGLGLFLLGMIIVFIPVFRWGINKLFITKDFSTRFPVEKLVLIGALTPVVFYYFNTQMHGRYAHATVLFGGVYALLTARYAVYCIMSLAYFLNMEVSAKILKEDILEYPQLFMRPSFIATLFAIGLIWGLVELYKPIKKKGELL